MLLMLLAPARAHGIRRLADEAGDCYVGDGSTYTGNVSVTANGTACQPWAEDTPHTHTHHHDLPSNYCRNPDGEPAPWCYTVSPDVRWELCDIPQCVSEEGMGNGNTSQSDGAAHVGGESSATVCTNTCSHPYDNECDDGGEGALQKRAKERSSTCAAHCMLFILTRPTRLGRRLPLVVLRSRLGLRGLRRSLSVPQATAAPARPAGVARAARRPAAAAAGPIATAANISSSRAAAAA